MKLGIVDTTFSRVDMGAIALDELRKHYPDVQVERRTVPGIKDLPVECKMLLEGAGRAGDVGTNAACDVVMALGMVGGAPIDTQCAHEASLGIQDAKLLTNRHIIEVFVHENEGWDGKELASIFDNRVRKHVHNAVLLVKKPEALQNNAGKGVRQGKDDEGALAERKTRLAFIVAEFNTEITGRMRKKAAEVAKREGVDAEFASVPGVFDMPLVAMKKLMDKRVDGVVALGAVIKGETAHDEVIAKDVARRLGDLSLEFRKPVALGIIGHGVAWEAAEARAEEYAERAALAALKVLRVLRDEEGS